MRILYSDAWWRNFGKSHYFRSNNQKKKKKRLELSKCSSVFNSFPLSLILLSVQTIKFPQCSYVGKENKKLQKCVIVVLNFSELFLRRWFLHFFPHDLGRRVYMLMPIRTVGAALHILNRCRSITAALYRVGKRKEEGAREMRGRRTGGEEAEENEGEGGAPSRTGTRRADDGREA